MFAGCRIVHRPHKHEVSPFSNQGHALARGGNASLYPLFVAGLRSRLVIIPPSRQRWPTKSCRLLWAPPPTTHRHTSGTSTAGCGESGALGTHEAKVAESVFWVRTMERDKNRHLSTVSVHQRDEPGHRALGLEKVWGRFGGNRSACFRM